MRRKYSDMYNKTGEFSPDLDQSNINKENDHFKARKIIPKSPLIERYRSNHYNPQHANKMGLLFSALVTNLSTDQYNNLLAHIARCPLKTDIEIDDILANSLKGFNETIMLKFREELKSINRAANSTPEQLGYNIGNGLMIEQSLVPFMVYSAALAAHPKISENSAIMQL